MKIIKLDQIFIGKKDRSKYFIQLPIFPITLLMKKKKKTIWRKVFRCFSDGHLLREIIFIWIRGSSCDLVKFELLEEGEGRFGNTHGKFYLPKAAGLILCHRKYIFGYLGQQIGR